MNEPSQETINRALLGDPDALEACNDAHYALLCPLCGHTGARTVVPHYGIDAKPSYWYTCEGAECSNSTPSYSSDTEALAAWNARANTHDAARELYTPQWIPCADALPPDQKDVRDRDREWLLLYMPHKTRKITLGQLIGDWWFCGIAHSLFRRDQYPNLVSHWMRPTAPTTP